MATDAELTILTDIKQSIGRIEGTLTATVAAHDKRFEAIEADVKSKDTRHFVVSACVIPIVTGLHYLANKVGIKV
jgi:hypothetical protein